MPPMCMQDAHEGRHRSPSNSQTFARFLYKNWLGWNSTDSSSCLKTCSCRSNGDSLCEVLGDSSGIPHWAPVCTTLPYLQPLHAAAFLHSARRASRAAAAATPASPSLPAIPGAEHERTAARSWQEGTWRLFPLLLPEAFLLQSAGARGSLQPWLFLRSVILGHSVTTSEQITTCGLQSSGLAFHVSRGLLGRLKLSFQITP